MGGAKKQKTPADELIESLLQDVGDDESSSSESSESSEDVIQLSEDDDGYSSKTDNEEEDDDLLDSSAFANLMMPQQKADGGFVMTSEKTEFADKTQNDYEATRKTSVHDKDGKTKHGVLEYETVTLPQVPSSSGQIKAQNFNHTHDQKENELAYSNDVQKIENIVSNDLSQTKDTGFAVGDNDKTVAVAGYQYRNSGDATGVSEKISVGQNRSSYAVWNSGGAAESNLAQADNLRIAQEKILELESDNEKLRMQNEELIAASEIIKERSDLLSAQLVEYKNDRESLEESFKNEIVLLKNHLAKKDSELQKSQQKNDELESRLKFDMKKIRVRERELENRLELIRAEKNAIVKNKDEQILDLRRKMDVLQMEVESYRQKCIDLNKLIETNQESFKRTSRALRLAMANLELQEENKVPMKKAE
jgi:hypothetical protein